ncbi:MAG TPA: phosphoribosylpyrophosphate synthetase [Lachnospiraceae bacterium]|nr:phosphoribosylpyrophosphate synthetase [Lachnospiraceae bacterium]
MSEDVKLYQQLERKIPAAPLSLVIMPSAEKLGAQINACLCKFRKADHSIVKSDPAFNGYVSDDYRLSFVTERFETGEGRAYLEDSARGKDIFILTDVMNHSLTYQMNGFTHHMSPDDHFQDLKRVISAINGKAHRINVIMPFLYESRQHKRHSRESLDCAIALGELQNMGVSNVVTFDAHDPRVQNSTPLNGFDNFLPPYQFIKALIHYEKDLIIDKEHLVVISPDEGALDRAVYFAGVLGVDTGMFYKRRDYSKVVNGKNPIVAHEFLGDNIDGKDVIVIDDMISSGGSMIDTSRQLKEMNAKRVFICCTFGLFTEGLSIFDEAYEKCYFDKIITTNLVYHPPGLLTKPYYIEADMSKFLASIIDFLNHDTALSRVHTPTGKIQSILKKYNNREDLLIQ